MPKLFNSYCYTDINAVANSIGSHFFIGDGQVLQSVSVLNADQLSLSFLRESSTHQYVITSPDCTREGFDNSFFGVSTSDAVQVTWLSIIVIIIAWSIKNLKRGR